MKTPKPTDADLKMIAKALRPVQPMGSVARWLRCEFFTNEYAEDEKPIEQARACRRAILAERARVRRDSLATQTNMRKRDNAAKGFRLDHPAISAAPGSEVAGKAPKGAEMGRTPPKARKP